MPKHNLITISQALRSYTPSFGSDKELKVITSSLSTNTGEKAKTALTGSPPFAELVFHSIAICIIILITYLNITNRFWQEVQESGPVSDNGFHFTQSSELHGLQFAAKLHELFMQASLSAMVLYYAHRLLVGTKGVPFGLIDFPYNSNSLGMLRHWRFWQTGFFSTQYLSFATLLLVVCILSVIVGPSSAILVIPSPGWWHNRNPFNGQNMTTYFLANTTDIWPSTFTLSAFDPAFVSASLCEGVPTDPIIGCPLQGFPEIISWFLGYALGSQSDNFTVSEVISNAYRSVSSTVQNASYAYQMNNLSATTSYTTSLTDRMVLSLGTFWNYVQRSNVGSIGEVSKPRLRVKSDIDTYQPLVHVACQSYLYDGTQTNITFLPSINAWNAGSYIDEPWLLDGQSEILDNLPSITPRFSFYKDTRVNSSTSLLTLAIIPVLSSNSTDHAVQGSDILSCSIDARWAANEITYQPKDFGSILTNLTDPSIFENVNESSPQFTINEYGISNRPIDLELDWAGLLNYNWTGDTANDYEYNGYIPATTMTGLLFIPLVNASVGTNISTFQISNDTSMDYYKTIESTIATLLGIVITDAISRTSSCAPVPYLDINQTYNSLLDLTDLTSAPTTQYATELNKPGDFILSYDVERYGYGYGLNSSTSKAALTALLFYSVMVILHVCYVVMLGLRGRYQRTTAWGDIHGLVALAKNSAPTDSLYGTSAGVDEKKTWALKVRVREVGCEQLDLVFDDDPRLYGGSIRVGKKYR
ncbi:uncharacterized protein LY89DRAFT_140576 [Mollisia scopiformis]|uniref:Uncharacterized protein n=1 Tax=Mollisia scopiformis TaxID=149040 RepID=A0A194X375_MOLSC|nr:uncharacterized protein LY89DRAFT_140576 [Mollisia scopiformis]KUJ14474.1 hypothetical protein LY89DRAFT_140576 [Mollisia scopiformis]